MLDKNTYQVREPLTQVKGNNPITGVLTYYKMDANGELIYRYNASSKTWEFFRESGPFAIPINITSALSANDMEIIQGAIIDSGLVKLRTEYLIIGDEPPMGKGVLDLRSKLGEERYKQISSLMTVLPRVYLRKWFDKTIMPSLESYGNFVPMVWAAFIDIFNEANLKHINEKKIDPWAWEEEKIKNYYLIENKAVLDELNQKFAAYRELNTSPDAVAQSLMVEYQKLKPLGDPGLEVSRQYAVKELLAKKDYASVKGIIEAYRYADYTILGEAIASPVPFDIVSSQGTVVKATN